MKFHLIAVSFLFSTLTAAWAMPPAFHNIPYKTIYRESKDLLAQGLTPHTLSGCYDGQRDDYFYSGVYNRDNPNNQSKIMTSLIDFHNSQQKMVDQGYVPKEYSFMTGRSNGYGLLVNANTVYAKPTHPTRFEYSMDDGEFDGYYRAMMAEGYRIKDYNQYASVGKRQHAAIFVKDGRGFYFYWGLNATDFQAKARVMGQKGYVPESLNIVNLAWGEVYSGIWVKPTQITAWYYGMDSAAYQARFDQMLRQGYQLQKVISYANCRRFAAIWTKP